MRRVRKGRLSFFQIGLITLVLLGILTYLGFTKSIPFRHHYTVSAVFTTANNLKKGSPVRIAGVNVGKVSSVDFLHPGQPAARVLMRLDPAALPLHADAKFKIRTRIFVEGNFFVDIEPGSPNAPVVGDGHLFPISQTATPVQLDQILTTLQSSTRQDLQVVLKELDRGFSGKGARGYNRSIPYWEPAYKNGAIVSTATLGTEPHDLSNYIKGAGVVAQALDRDPVRLKALVSDFDTTAHAFAVRQQDLSSAIGELPRTLAAGLPALRSLNNAFPNVRRLVVALRPAVRSSGPSIDATLPFVDQLRKLVSKPELRGLTADLRPTVPSLAKLNNETVPLYEQVRAASSCQNTVILPWSHDTVPDKAFPATGQVYTETPKTLVGLSGESRSGDANGQWFRILDNGGQYAYPNGNGGFLLTQLPLEGANPVPTERSPLRPDVPCETQQPPDLRSNPGAPPPGGVQITPAPDTVTRQAQALTSVVDFAQNLLKHDGIPLPVSSTPLTVSQIPQLGKATP